MALRIQIEFEKRESGKVGRKLEIINILCYFLTIFLPPYPLPHSLILPPSPSLSFLSAFSKHYILWSPKKKQCFLTSVSLPTLFCLPRTPSLSSFPALPPPSKINSRMSFYSFLKPSLRYPTKLQSVLSFELRVSLVVIIIFSLRLQLFVYLVLFPLLSYNFL